MVSEVTRAKYKLAGMKKRNRKRFYIQLNCKPYVPGLKAVWPMLFVHEDDAWEAIKLLPVFSPRPDGRRIISASVESRYI